MYLAVNPFGPCPSSGRSRIIFQEHCQISRRPSAESFLYWYSKTVHAIRKKSRKASDTIRMRRQKRRNSPRGSDNSPMVMAATIPARDSDTMMAVIKSSVPLMPTVRFSVPVSRINRIANGSNATIVAANPAGLSKCPCAPRTDLFCNSP